MIATIPPPPIDNLQVGPLTLHLYGLLIGIGVLVALQLTTWLLNREGLDGDAVFGLMLPAVIAGFIGARLYHVISNPREFAEDPASIIAIWNGGLGIWGAIGLGAAVGIWQVRRTGRPLGSWMDASVPGIAFAQAIGRWGNYVNEELFGRPTTLPWGLELSEDALPAKYADAPDTTFHPTFLYESLGLTILGIVLLLLVLKWDSRPRGAVFALYVMGYCALRFPIEGLRIDEAHSFLGLRQNEWLSLVLFGGALVAFIRLLRHGKRGPAPVEST